MKKIVTLEKQIVFPSMIGEISAISLEKNINFIDCENLEGELFLNGKYKLTEASRLEEDFSYKIPVEIALTNKIVNDSGTIEVTDFYYEIVNDNTMVCHIELTIEGEEVAPLVDEDRECDGEEKEVEIPVLTKEEETNKIEVIEEDDISVAGEEEKEEEEEVEDTNNSLYINLTEESESYGTFVVYIVRGNESINSIIEKYNTTIEELEKYNDIKEINIGTKLIIPLKNE